MNTWSISSMIIQFFAYNFVRVYEITEEERRKLRIKIVNRCNVVECKYKKDAVVFKVPQKNPELKEKWLKFLNRKDLPQENYIFICKHHFEEKYLKKKMITE